MNNKSSVFERLLMYMILAYAGMWIMHNYFDKGSTAKVADRPAKTLTEAFAGIDPASISASAPALTPATVGQGGKAVPPATPTAPGTAGKAAPPAAAGKITKPVPALTKETAAAEIKSLEADIAQNDKDDRARWDHLRIGLIQQYILDHFDTGTTPSGFLHLGPALTNITHYNEVVKAGKHDAIEAQALYQEGDYFWRQSLHDSAKKGETEAVTSFEAIIANERSSKDFRDAEIYVTKELDPAKVPLNGIPALGFKQVPVSSLRGTLTAPNPQGVLDRINEHYKPSFLYKLFDTIVRALGDQPGYSYGLAILIFAVCTRTVMQPLSKKQYESMKGMALIAPEMKKIQERYKNKSDQESQMKMVKEIQELQRRHGVNPYMGCVLAFVQMPVFFVLVYPMIKHYQPTMDLAGAHFLWIADLSQKDIVLLVLYGISMFFSFRLSSTPPHR